MTYLQSGKKYALLISCSNYSSDLSQISAPDSDVESLSNILNDTEIGGYNVKSVINENSYLVRQEIETFFSERRKDDTCVLYISCHGLKDKYSQLYFACTDTKSNRLQTTSVSAEFISYMMKTSACRTQILILDCCYSGAFAWAFTKSDPKIHVGDYIESQGKIVLTASDDLQFAYIDDKLSEVQNKYAGSIFTNAIVQGLKTGEADLNGDGVITPEELYDYAYNVVVKQKPEQTPTSWGLDKKGSIHFAKSIKKKVTVSSIYNSAISTMIPKSVENPIQKLTNISTRNIDWYLTRGDQFRELDRFVEALEMYDEVTILDPDNKIAWFYKGYSLGKLERYAEAIDAYEEAIKIDPKYADAWYGKGYSLGKLERYAEAIDAYEEAIKIDPKFADAWFNKGHDLDQLGRKQDADNAFKKAKELNYSS
jgi:tetratricopeptide (TPR) repeat protein